MIHPSQGILLIAEPFLKDPSFMRTAVLLCRHTPAEGTFGFTLNKIFERTLDEIIPGMEGHEMPVFLGGPVGTDTLHYIHTYPEYFPDAEKITDDIFWGGDFELMKTLIKNGTVSASGIKFFLGYSGWEAGQLETEMEGNSWLTTDATKKIVMDTPAETVWNACLLRLGGKYKMMIHYPTDPQLN